MCNCYLIASVSGVWFGKVTGFHFCALTSYSHWYQEGHSCKSPLGHTHDVISHMRKQVREGYLPTVTGQGSGGASFHTLAAWCAFVREFSADPSPLISQASGGSDAHVNLFLYHPRTCNANHVKSSSAIGDT